MPMKRILGTKMSMTQTNRMYEMVCICLTKGFEENEKSPFCLLYSPGCVYNRLELI